MKITFKPEEVTTFIKNKVTLLGAAAKAGVEIESICGGRGICGKCKIKVIIGKEALPPITSQEKKILTNDEIKYGYRLACMVKPRLDATVYISPKNRRKMKLQTEGLKIKAMLKPAIKKYYMEIPKASLSDQRSDEDRFLEALTMKYNLRKISLSYNALRKLPSTLRKNDWKITAVLWNKEIIIDVESGDTSTENFGVAIDVGTTKIALYLLNLIDGKESTVVSIENPQRSFGEDIMTRMTFANRGKRNLQKLHETIINALNDLISKACSIAKVQRSNVYEAVLVGNTVMHHFLLNLETRYLSQSPYTQVLRRPFNCPSSSIDLQINNNGYFHMLPTIKSFVGSDNVAVCLVTRISEAKKPTLSLDIGTNTEINCSSKGMGLTVTSTPSGPAFEGWGIKWGVIASDGAIEKIFIEPDTLEVVYRTIGNKPPVGICGSGYVDAIAEMMKAGILNHRTGFNEVKSSRIRRGEEGYEMVMVAGKESGIGKDIVVTQRDVSEIVKAKAAIHAATTILLNHLKLEEDDINKIFLAGAFGSYMDSENARAIGMLPEVDLEKIVPIGNAAGSGAKLALLNFNKRHEAEKISVKATFIELATHPMFVKEYVNSMFLPYKNLNKYPKTMKFLKRM